MIFRVVWPKSRRRRPSRHSEGMSATEILSARRFRRLSVDAVSQMSHDSSRRDETAALQRDLFAAYTDPRVRESDRQHIHSLLFASLDRIVAGCINKGRHSASRGVRDDILSEVHERFARHLHKWNPVDCPSLTTYMNAHVVGAEKDVQRKIAKQADVVALEVEDSDRGGHIGEAFLEAATPEPSVGAAATLEDVVMDAAEETGLNPAQIAASPAAHWFLIGRHVAAQSVAPKEAFSVEAFTRQASTYRLAVAA